MSIVRTRTWSLTTPPLIVLHFDWPVETKAIRKLSKSCQHLIKTFLQWHPNLCHSCDFLWFDFSTAKSMTIDLLTDERVFTWLKPTWVAYRNVSHYQFHLCLFDLRLDFNFSLWSNLLYRGKINRSSGRSARNWVTWMLQLTDWNHWRKSCSGRWVSNIRILLTYYNTFS